MFLPKFFIQLLLIFLTIDVIASTVLHFNRTDEYGHSIHHKIRSGKPIVNRGILRILAETNEPYTIRNDNHQLMYGIEAEFIKALSKKLDLKVIYQDQDSHFNRSLIDENYLNQKCVVLVVGYSPTAYIKKLYPNFACSHIDLLMGGKSHHSSPKLRPTVSYDQDSLTFCIARVKPIPKWKNIFLLLKDKWVPILSLIGLMTATILSYVHGWHERWPYDLFTMYLKCLQLLIANATNLNVSSTSTRLVVTIQMWASLWAYITNISLYISIMNQQLYQKQISSTDILTNNYQLATDADGFKLMNDVEMVSLLSGSLSSLFFFCSELFLSFTI